MPNLPTEHLNLRYIPLITPTNPSMPHGSGPSRPSTWEDSLIRAQKVAAGTEVPPNYDFPFGIPALLIQTSYDPLWMYRSRPHRPPAMTPSAEGEEVVREVVSEDDATTAATAAALTDQNLPTLLEPPEIPVTPSLDIDSSLEESRPPQVREAREQPPLSVEPERRRKRIHVLATNVRASYIAFALSTVSNRPPVGLVLPDIYRKKYLQEGRRISVLRNDLWSESHHLQAEPCKAEVYDGDQNHIDYLVLTTHPSRTARWLSRIAPRIDDRTVLCLIQDGLGVPELLNSTVFQDPDSRPTYVLGHMTHMLRHLRKSHNSQDWFRFALGEEPDPGVLHLSAYTPRDTSLRGAMGGGVLGGAHSSDRLSSNGILGRSHAENFVYSMWRSPRLNVVSLSVGDFLVRKLPTMVFQSVVEPVSALLDCDYGELCRSRVGLDKVEQLLHEVSQVILALPELSHEHKFLDYVASRRLRGDVLGRLRNTAPTQESEMRWLMRNGRPTDVDFLSGWFLQRARELGVDCPRLEMAVEMVKGKAKVQRKRTDNIIAFQNPPKFRNHYY